MTSKIYNSSFRFFVLIILLLVVNSCTKEFRKNDHEKKLTIKNAWIRSASAGMNTALFFDVVGSRFSVDTLKSVESDAAELIQIHETIKDETGMMSMKEIGLVIIPRAKVISFKPMGKHVMFIVLKNDLFAGDSVKVKFVFSKSKPIVKNVVVKNFNKSGAQ